MQLTKKRSVKLLQLSKLKLKCLSIQQPQLKDNVQEMIKTTNAMIRDIRSSKATLGNQTIELLLELFSIDVEEQYKSLTRR
tara:strand:+ start:1272 stop:1514 length:243 start_codon:yes stop_codon:yes gene_type:complete